MLENRLPKTDAVQENLILVRSFLSEIRQVSDEDQKKWEWLDFLEINIMTQLSNLVEYIYNGAELDELPQPAPIEWKSPRHEREYFKLWEEFLSAKNQMAVRRKLERMFLLWKYNASPFGLKQAYN